MLSINRTENQEFLNHSATAQALSEREATYYAALDLVAIIEEQLKKGTRHYRTKAGLFLTTLDEVVRAILDDDLLAPEPEETEVVWARELAA